MQGSDIASPLENELAWANWRERLLAQFEDFSHGEQQTHLYLVVDSRANPGLDKLLAQVPGLAWASLWQDSVFESYVDIAPYLIRIDRTAFSESRDIQSRLVRRLWTQGRDVHALTWLWSALPLDSLSKHLRHFSHYVTEDRHEFFLHLYDNRILMRVLSVWTEGQARAFLSPCAQLWYVDRDLNEIVYCNPAPTVDIDISGEQMLSVEQHKDLLRHGVPDKLAMQLRDMYGAILSDLSDAALWHRVSDQIERAATYRIPDEDLLIYVAKGLVISPAFDEHPFIQERLDRAALGELTHREALSNIDREVLIEVSRLHAKATPFEGEPDQ
ncbi:DUF4123 domain-containing protein [Pandoraea sp. NPDC087047]|uniref:DUF4123 domain-containing protein n=1 Tax=Pandoraea sp. NPDC087047 TaxID=3364390 RepID=UPI0037F4CA1F